MRRDARPRLFRSAQAIYLGLVLALLILPLVALVPMSFSPSATIVALPERFSTRWYETVFRSPEWRSAFGWSVLIAAASSVIATTMGYLAATAIVRTDSRLRPALQLLVLSPMMVPGVVVALSTYVLATSLGLSGSWTAIAIGQSLLGLPVATLIIAASLRGINESILRAAVSLGGRDNQIFWRVILPMALHGIVSAIALSFLIAFDELLIAAFLATPGLQTLPVRIYQAVHFELSPALAVISVLMIALVCAFLIVGQLYVWTTRRISGARSPAP